MDMKEFYDKQIGKLALLKELVIPGYLQKVKELGERLANAKNSEESNKAMEDLIFTANLIKSINEEYEGYIERSKEYENND